jgi:hypothetical protein
VRHEPLQPSQPAHGGWLERLRAGRIASRLVTGLRRDVPDIVVDPRPTIVDGAWTLGVTLPPEIEPGRFLAGTVAERVPWVKDRQSAEPGRVRVPFAPGYSEEEQDQLVLVAAKVLHYLQQPEPSPAG